MTLKHIHDDHDNLLGIIALTGHWLAPNQCTTVHMWETRLGRGDLEPLEGRSLPSSEAEIKCTAGGLGPSRSRVSRYPRARRISLRGFEEASVAPYRTCTLEFSWMFHKWTKFQQSPTNSKVRNEGQKDHYDVSSLIYQSFGMSPLTGWTST